MLLKIPILWSALLHTVLLSSAAHGGTQIGKPPLDYSPLEPCYEQGCLSAKVGDHNGIPRIIHQTTGNAHTIRCGLMIKMASWIRLNPKHRYVLWEPHHRRELVKRYLPDHDLFYDGLLSDVERADIFKYLVMYVHGGVYADQDVKCVTPIEQWPAKYPNLPFLTNQTHVPLSPTSKILLGIEAIHPVSKDKTKLFSNYGFQLGVWTLAASPGQSLFLRICTQSMQFASIQYLHLIKAAHEHRPGSLPLASIASWDGYYKTVLRRTGPFLFTRTMYSFGLLPKLTRAPRYAVTDEEYKRLSPGYRIGNNVFVMPINAFGAGQTHSGSGWIKEPGVLVLHTFAGSWKFDKAMSRICPKARLLFFIQALNTPPSPPQEVVEVVSKAPAEVVELSQDDVTGAGGKVA